MKHRRALSKLAAPALIGLALTGVADDATACGGFFCSQTPVDQTAERIIFTVNDDDTVTAYIQVTYAGDRDNFAWIVPVPGEVAPDVFPQRALTGLDLATQPTYTTTSCAALQPALGGAFAGGNPVALDSAEDDGVMVIQEQRFGPFDSVTITGDDAEQLVSWLQDNGYRITESMVPYIEQYVNDGMAFFAMKLLPEADILDISPVKLTYAGNEPMIPIRLTTIATQPEMGIVAWVLGNEKYAAKNYAEVAIPDELIEFDLLSYTGRNNYLTVVSKEVDKAGGQGFVTEYAAPTGPLAQIIEDGSVPESVEGAQEAEDQLVALLRSRSYVTRLYTRMSAEEMTVDPYFAVAAASGDVDNVHNLACDEGTSVGCECEDGSTGTRTCGAPSYGWYGGCACEGDEASVEDPAALCGITVPPSPCSFTYCGREGVCLGNDAALPVCVCAEGATARPRTTTAGEIQLYCEPLQFNFQVLPDVDTPDALMFPDACAGFDCGENGSCLTMNGTATCQCEAGYGATITTTVDGLPDIKCEAVQGVMPSLPLLPNIGETTIEPEVMDPEMMPAQMTPVATGSAGGAASTAPTMNAGEMTPPAAAGSGSTGDIYTADDSMTETSGLVPDGAGTRRARGCSTGAGHSTGAGSLWALAGGLVVARLARRPRRRPKRANRSS